MVELNELVSGRLDVAEEVELEMTDLGCLILTSEGMDEFEPLSDGLKKQCEDYEIKFIIDVIKKYENDLKLTVVETAEIVKNADLKTYIQVYEKLCLVEDILYLREEDFSGINHYRYVLPKNMIEYCFRKIHCDNYAGHLGQKKTIKKVIERFYRPKLAEEIKLLVRSCDICQKIKRQIADKAEIHPIILYILNTAL